MTKTKEIQKKITQLLNRRLKGDILAQEEWNVAKDSIDGYDNKIIYAPRVDVAVSPFMINYVTLDEKEKFDRAFDKNNRLINRIIQKGETFEDFEYNQNPRCLMAIEIETSGTRKHLIGDITNASILGKIGIIVPTDDKNYNAFKRIMSYLKFAQRNRKITNNVFKNIILIKSKELISLLRR